MVFRRGVVLLVIVLVGAACAGGEGSADSATSSPDTTTTTAALQTDTTAGVPTTAPETSTTTSAVPDGGEVPALAGEGLSETSGMVAVWAVGPGDWIVGRVDANPSASSGFMDFGDLPPGGGDLAKVGFADVGEFLWILRGIDVSSSSAEYLLSPVDPQTLVVVEDLVIYRDDHGGERQAADAVVQLAALDDHTLVATIEVAEAVFVVDVDEMAVTETTALSGAPVALATADADSESNEGGGFVYTLSRSPAILDIVSSSGELLRSVEFESRGASLAAGPDGPLVGLSSGIILDVSAATGEQVQTWELNASLLTGARMACCIDGSLTVPLGSGHVAFLDLETGSVDQIEASGVFDVAIGTDATVYYSAWTGNLKAHLGVVSNGESTVAIRTLGVNIPRVITASP